MTAYYDDDAPADVRTLESYDLLTEIEAAATEARSIQEAIEEAEVLLDNRRDDSALLAVRIDPYHQELGRRMVAAGETQVKQTGRTYRLAESTPGFHWIERVSEPASVCSLDKHMIPALLVPADVIAALEPTVAVDPSRVPPGDDDDDFADFAATLPGGHTIAS